jgi:hypothetical protein
MKLHDPEVWEQKQCGRFQELVQQALQLQLLLVLVLVLQLLLVLPLVPVHSDSLGSTVGLQQWQLQMSSDPVLHTAWMLAACHEPFLACPWCCRNAGQGT